MTSPQPVGRHSDWRNFVFFEYRLKRRAKQWHYVIIAHLKTRLASRFDVYITGAAARAIWDVFPDIFLLRRQREEQ